MTKKEIARLISDELDLTHQFSQQVLQKALDVIVEVLAAEGQVELRKFGVFKLKERPARMGRNPKTGEAISIKEKSIIVFKPGKEMEARIQAFASRRGSRNALSGPSDSEDQDGPWGSAPAK